MYDTRQLSPPMQVDGVGGRIHLTHQGRLKALPPTNNMNRAYYSKDLPSNLISLGYLQRCGATYGTDPDRPRTHVIIRLDPTGPTLTSVALSDNNLLPIDFSTLGKPSRAAAMSTSQHPNSIPRALISPHHTAEQLRRAEEAEQLHHDRSHPSDDALCADLSHGKIPWSTLTCPDVRLNRSLRGPCAHCLAGKMTTPHTPSSTSAPTISPGAVLNFNIHQLPETSPGGFTHAIHVVDEHSGKFDVIGSISKSTLAISRAIRHLIVEYNADGHRVGHMHGDAEKINATLSSTLGLLGIKLQLSLPGEHAKRIERYERTLNERTTATLSALCYYLPVKYTLPLHKSISRTMNDSICSQSAPSTPNEIIGRPKPTRAPLAFGRSCIVTQHEDKRQTTANANSLPLNHIGKVELGVSMGHDPTTKHTLFLLANGLILPRRIRFTLPATFTPFNWTPKEYHIAQQIPPPARPSPIDATKSLNTNHVIQLPDIDPASAIHFLSEHLPESLPHHTLESIRTPAPLRTVTLPMSSGPQPLELQVAQPLQTPAPPLDATNPAQLTTPVPDSAVYGMNNDPTTPTPSPSPMKGPPPTTATTATPTIQVLLRTSSRSNFGTNPHLQRLHSQESDNCRKSAGQALLSAAITRKIAAIKVAALRNKLHVKQNNSTQFLNKRIFMTLLRAGSNPIFDSSLKKKQYQKIIITEVQAVKSS